MPIELACPSSGASAVRLGPPTNGDHSPFASGGEAGTTYAYWTVNCSFATPLRVHLNESTSDFGGNSTTPNLPSAPPPPLARIVLISGSFFGAFGGVEVAGPETRYSLLAFSHVGSALTWPENATALWGAAPLNVTIKNNTLSSGAVIRFIGALPPLSSLLIADNVFDSATFFPASASSFTLTNVLQVEDSLQIGDVRELVDFHTLILVTHHRRQSSRNSSNSDPSNEGANDNALGYREGMWALVGRTAVIIRNNMASSSALGWGARAAGGQPYAGVVVAAVASGDIYNGSNSGAASNVTLSSDSTFFVTIAS